MGYSPYSGRRLRHQIARGNNGATRFIRHNGTASSVRGMRAVCVANAHRGRHRQTAGIAAARVSVACLHSASLILKIRQCWLRSGATICRRQATPQSAEPRPASPLHHRHTKDPWGGGRKSTGLRNFGDTHCRSPRPPQVAHCADSRSACSSTVLTAASCRSGGKPYFRRMRFTRTRSRARAGSRWVQSTDTLCLRLTTSS